jgi:tetratricopeptide (TPR) repeat protein
MLNKIVLVLMLVLGWSCDFTSGLNQDILLAQGYVESQDFQKAVDLYLRVLKKNPPKNIRIKIQYQIGEIQYLYLDQQIKALDHYQYIVDNVDDPLWQVKAMEKIADINFNFARRYNEAISAYQVLMKFRPRLANFDMYYFRIGESHFQKGDYQKAHDIFLEVIQQGYHSYLTESYYHLGLIEFYQKKWDKAVDWWFEYLKREKQKDKIVRVKFLIANAYESNEKLKEAYNIYYSLLPDYPNPEVLKSRLKSLYARRVARKR